MHGGVVIEVGLRGDLREALRRVVADEQVAAVNADVADDELTVVDRHAADVGADAGLIRLRVFLHVRQALIDARDAVVARIDLIDARQAAAAVGVDAAAEIELVLVADGVAEQRGDAVERLGHEQGHLAGVYVDLHEHAAGVAAVLLPIEERAVEDGVELGAHGLLVELVAHGGPGVALAAVALTVGAVGRAGHGHRAVAGVIDQAVRLAGRAVRVRDLAEGVVSGVVSVGGLGLSGVRRQCRDHQAHDHGCDQQQGQKLACSLLHRYAPFQMLQDT